MNRIVLKAKNLAKKYHTNDPFELCSHLQICLTITELPKGINGFYNTVFGMPFIYINSGLTRCERKAVCAHELGHMILHPQMNTLFIKTKTIINASKLEHEADVFAAGLLIPNAIKKGDQAISVESLAYELDLPQELVRLKLCL